MIVALLWLAGTLIPMLFLYRWISRHIQGIGLLVGGKPEIAITLYFLIMFPGILLHELSHWIMARILGLRTGRISLGPTKTRGGKVQLGAVQVSRADPLREALVGMAPLLTGSLAVLAIGVIVFDLRALTQAFVVGDIGHFFAILGRSVLASDFWLWLYLIFVISNSMLPSETDWMAWLPLAAFFGVVTLIVGLIGWIPQIPAATVDTAIGMVQYLNIAFFLTLLVDALAAGAIFGIERMLMKLTGSRIRY